MSQTLKFRVAGVGLLAGAIALLFITSTTNWVQGVHDGVTDSGRLINSVGSVAVDIMGLLFCGLAVGICMGIRKWGWAFVFGLGLLFSAVWSGYSVYSFRASEEISASATRATANSRIEEADKLAKESVSKMTTFAGKARSSAARDDFIYGTQEAIKSFRDAEVKVIIPPAAGTQVVADRLGWKLETIQVIRSAFFSFLIIFLKMIGFPGAGFLLSWSPESAPASVSSSPKGGSGNDGESEKSSGASSGKQPASDDANVIPIRADATQPEIVWQDPQPPKVRSGAPRVPAPAPEPSLKSEYETVAEFLAREGSAPSQKAIAQRMGVSQAKVSRDLKKLKGQGKVQLERNWRSNAVRRNGASIAFGH
jgi:hypothetical protein